MAEAESFACRWDAVVLVCRQCRQRGSGPDKLKTKEVAGALRRALKQAPARPRVVLTQCLGLCPKRAMTVAHIGPDQPASLWAVRSVDEASALGERWGRRGDGASEIARPAVSGSEPL